MLRRARDEPLQIDPRKTATCLPGAGRRREAGAVGAGLLPDKLREVVLAARRGLVRLFARRAPDGHVASRTGVGGLLQDGLDDSRFDGAPPSRWRVRHRAIAGILPSHRVEQQYTFFERLAQVEVTDDRIALLPVAVDATVALLESDRAERQL